MRDEDYFQPTPEQIANIIMPTLDDFESILAQMASVRAARYAGRTGPDPDLPMLISDANLLRPYYEEVGVVYETDQPAKPPPLPGEDGPSQPVGNTGENQPDQPGEDKPPPGPGEDPPTPTDEETTTTSTTTTSTTTSTTTTTAPGGDEEETP